MRPSQIITVMDYKFVRLQKPVATRAGNSDISAQPADYVSCGESQRVPPSRSERMAPPSVWLPTSNRIAWVHPIGICRLVSVFLASILFAATAAASPESIACVTEPSLTLKLGSPVASILASVTVDRGDAVKAGQAVARIQSSVEKAIVAANKIRAESMAEITAKQAVLSQKADILKRKVVLGERRFASTQDIENAAAEYNVAKQELVLAQLNHRMAQIELQQSEAELALRTIRSPINGIVTQRSLGPGEFVSQQATIVTIARIDPLYVETYVPVHYYKFIKLGETAIVRLNNPFPGDRQAKVGVIDQVFDAASGTFGVRLELPNPHNALPAGLRCHVVFDVPQDATDPSAASKQNPP
jgi:membrane fusion protein (multidrug efflux system)